MGSGRRLRGNLAVFTRCHPDRQNNDEIALLEMTTDRVVMLPVARGGFPAGLHMRRRPRPAAWLRSQWRRARLSRCVELHGPHMVGQHLVRGTAADVLNL